MFGKRKPLRKDQYRAINAGKKKPGIKINNEIEKKIIEANLSEIRTMLSYQRGEISLDDFENKIKDSEHERLKTSTELYNSSKQ